MTIKPSIALVSALLVAPLATNTFAQSLTVDTSPTGLSITVNGTNYAAPATFNWDIGSVHTLDTPSPQISGDAHSRSVFSFWSDGGSQNHSVSMPASDTNYTATFSTQYLLDQ